MARKPRIEFEGAYYHVINRGNYRSDVFATDKTKAAFEKCLFEACELKGWRLHAYVKKGAHWKVAMAAELRQTTAATNRWIAHALHMGKPNSVSKYLSWQKIS